MQGSRPDTLAERIRRYLQHYPEGATDTDIENALGAVHQHVNTVCRGLVKRGVLVRHQVGPTIRNVLVPLERQTAVSMARQRLPLAVAREAAAAGEVSRPWFWEGNVQSAVVTHLRSDGWSILRTANTSTHEPGKDIEAARGAGRLWVTVKGFPEGTARTNPNTQARHWFSHAMFDVVLWRQEDRSVDILVALPRKTTYINLSRRVTWFQEAAEFSFVWVAEQGVEMQEVPGGTVQG